MYRKIISYVVILSILWLDAAPAMQEEKGRENRNIIRRSSSTSNLSSPTTPQADLEPFNAESGRSLTQASREPVRRLSADFVRTSQVLDEGSQDTNSQPFLFSKGSSDNLLDVVPLSNQLQLTFPPLLLEGHDSSTPSSLESSQIHTSDEDTHTTIETSLEGTTPPESGSSGSSPHDSQTPSPKKNTAPSIDVKGKGHPKQLSDSEEDEITVDPTSRSLENMGGSWRDLRKDQKVKLQDMASRKRSELDIAESGRPSRSLLRRAINEGEEEAPFMEAGKVSLTQLKRQALFVYLPSEEGNIMSIAVPEDQPFAGDADNLVQKALALSAEIKGTSLEDFGRYYKGHIIDNTYQWQQWGALPFAGGMGVGTGAAMSPIVLWSLLNKYTAGELRGGTSYTFPLEGYIPASTFLIALTDSASFLTEATSPPTRTFTRLKSGWEKTADWILVPLATLPGVYLLLLHFEIQQEHKEVTKTTGWWNAYDQYFYFTSVGFFPYLVAQTWAGMRKAVDRFFHRDTPQHVEGRVRALRQLEARIGKDLSDEEAHDLYTLLRNPLFKNNASKLKEWANYCFRGNMSELMTVEGLLTYICLTKYAKVEMLPQEEALQHVQANKKNFASRVLGGLGIPAGFFLITISLYNVFESFMEPSPALALSLTGASLGFLAGGFLKSHNLEETLKAISNGIVPYLKGEVSVLDTLKDPYAWVSGIGNVGAYGYGIAQNILTNVAPVLASLAILLPETLGGDEVTQWVMTGVMGCVAIPYVLNELISGTYDIGNHVMIMARFMRSVYHKVHDFIAGCCYRNPRISSSRERRWIKQKLQETIAITLRLLPEHVERLETLERRLEGGNAEE